MSHHLHVPAATWLVMAPAATAMLMRDLQRGVARTRSGAVYRDRNPVGYPVAIAVNMLVVGIGWYEVADVFFRWMR